MVHSLRIPQMFGYCVIISLTRPIILERMRGTFSLVPFVIASKPGRSFKPTTTRREKVVSLFTEMAFTHDLKASPLKIVSVAVSTRMYLDLPKIYSSRGNWHTAESITGTLAFSFTKSLYRIMKPQSPIIASTPWASRDWMALIISFYSWSSKIPC